MSFDPPPHPGHSFVGFRGTSRAHYFIDKNQSIRYQRPPAEMTGSSQLGAGIYVTDSLSLALDYAQDQAWNLHVSRSKKRKERQRIAEQNADRRILEEVTRERDAFNVQQWRSYGRIHAVYIPVNKLDRYSIADFGHVNYDKGDDAFKARNADAFVRKNETTLIGLTTEYARSATDNVTQLQTIIYPPHTGSLYVKDVTDEAVSYLRVPAE
jgi:hypothetical protein